MARKARQLASGSWNVQVPIEKVKVGSKWKYKWVSITAPTKLEAELRAAEYEMTHDIAEKSSNNPTLKTAITEYINKSKGILSEATIGGYITIRDHSFRELMNLRIRSISNDMMNRAIQDEYRRKREKDGKPVSPKTVKNSYGLIASACKEYGVTWNVRLKTHKPPVHTLSTPDVLFQVFQGSEIELPVLLAMWMTFSMSEIRGFTKSGSIKGDMLYVDRVKVYTQGHDVIKPVAKNTTRNRGMLIPPYIKSLIDKVDGDELCPITSKMLEYKFTRAIKAAGLPHMTFHDLRHVAASTMEMLNIPDKYKQERGGWASDSIMRSTYVQTFNPIRREYDKVIDDYFGKIVGDHESV